MNAMHIVLVEPRIPQNTGNVVRTCKATGSVLHLVEPLGFEITDSRMRRAGLDYWKDMDIRRHGSLDAFLETVPPDSRLWLLSTKASRGYHEAGYQPGDYLVFGREDAGLPEELRTRYAPACLRIPMQGDTRSLNLSNSVALVLYEALRQQGFAGLW